MSHATSQSKPVSQKQAIGSTDGDPRLSTSGPTLPFTDQPALYGESPGYDPYDNRSGIGSADCG